MSIQAKVLVSVLSVFGLVCAAPAQASITVGSGSITGSGDISLQPSSGNVGIGTTTPTSGKLEIRRTSTDTSGNIRTLDLQHTVDPASNSSAVAQGIKNSVLVPYGNTSSTSYLTGMDNYVESSGTGNVSSMTGIYNFIFNANSANVSTLRGTESAVESDTGAVTNLTSVHAWSGIYGGSATNMTGLRIDDLVQFGGSTITNRYGIYINSYTGSATNDYAIYSAATQKSYFAGNVGLGLTTNQTGSKLEVKDGHYASSQTTAPTPSVTGTGYSGATLAAGSTDTKGKLTATVGAAVGTLVVTFQTAYGTAPTCTVTPASATAQVDSGKMYITTATGALTLNFVATPTGGSETWHYICMQ